MTDKRHYGTQTATSALEVPAPIRAEALELARVLRWLPVDLNEIWRELMFLKDCQRGWFITLYLLCGTSSIPGYLRVEALDIWKVVGARSEQWFQSHCGPILASFQFADIDGEKYLYHPRLLQVLAKQVEKLHKRRPKSEVSTGPPVLRGGEQLPLSLFSVLRAIEKPKGKSVPSEGVNDGRVSEDAKRITERYRELRAKRNGAE